MSRLDDNLRITEIFYSLQGEGLTTGCPTVFVRLTGCPLRCVYCDSAYAFHGGERVKIVDIIDKIKNFNTRFVTVTGGEPLAQPNSIKLLKFLCDENFIVSLETSGALSVSEVDSRVVKVLDIKTPGSGEVNRNEWNNLNHMNPAQDQIKFVICDYNDYLWSKNIIIDKKLFEKGIILFSPSFNKIELNDLADWILRDQLQVRLQMQFHKLIWGDIPGK